MTVLAEPIEVSLLDRQINLDTICGAAGELRPADAPRRWVVPHDRPHVVFLINCDQHRTAQTNVIERRVKTVEPQAADVALRV